MPHAPTPARPDLHAAARHALRQGLCGATAALAMCLAPTASAGEAGREMRCLGTQWSQGIGAPGAVSLPEEGPAEQVLVIEDGLLVFPDTADTDLEYPLCRSTGTQLEFSNQCGLTPQQFMARWRGNAGAKASPKPTAAGKPRGLRAVALPDSVDHVEVDSGSLSIRWTHLERKLHRTHGGARVYFIESEFEGKCKPLQLVL